MLTNTYTMRADLFQYFEKKVEKLNKKAVKAGVKPITYSIVKKEHIKRDYMYNLEYTVQVATEIIKIEGYTPVAILDHSYLATTKRNIINKIDTEKVLDEKYFTIPSICDHCGTNRKRKMTVLLEDTNGGIIQVGRTCLKDFLGHDINTALKIYEMLTDCEGFMADILPYANEIKQQPFYNNIQFLNIAKYLIDEEGYKKSIDCENGQLPTGKKAAEYIENINILDKYTRNNIEKFFLDEVEEDEEITSIVNWISNSDSNSNSDYMQNLKTLIDNNYCNFKDTNILASAIISYRREQEKILKSKNKQSLTDSYFGDINKRYDLELIYTGYGNYELYNNYTHKMDTIYIHRLIDDNGILFIWKTCNPISNANQGDKVKLKGTIKEHGEYKGQRQTILTRCKVIA